MTVRSWFQQMRAADFEQATRWEFKSGQDVLPVGFRVTIRGLEEPWTLFDTQRVVDRETRAHYVRIERTEAYDHWLRWLHGHELFPRLFASKLPPSSRPITLDDLTLGMAALLADDEESRRDRAGQIHEGHPPTADHVSRPVSQGLDRSQYYGDGLTLPVYRNPKAWQKRQTPSVPVNRPAPKPRVYKRDGLWWCSADGTVRYAGTTAAEAIRHFFNQRGDPASAIGP